MQKNFKLYEKQLYGIWEKQSFETSLKTNSGENIAVIDSGIFNDSLSGPDFSHARIRIGNLTFVGDVEIDRDYNDWKAHGHNIDNKYNKVILHVCFTNKFNQHYVYTKSGRKVPTIGLSNFISKADIDSINKIINEEKQDNKYLLKCSNLIVNLSTYEKKKVIATLGLKRFQKKCSNLFERLKELKYQNELKIKEPDIRFELTEEFQKRKFNNNDFEDKKLWQQLLYEFIFEALGYSKNKSAMMKLAQAVDVNFIYKIGNSSEKIHYIESALFNISGLVPKLDTKNNDVSKYKKRLVENWEIIKKIYDGRTFDETDWHFFKLRPQNFPPIRIAGGIKIINSIFYEDLIPIIIKKITEINKINVLINSLRSLFIVHSEGYWKNHYVFDNKAKSNIRYFIGVSRADEILINVILPFFSLYFDMFGKPDLSKKVLLTYNSFYQRGDNKLVQDIADSLYMKAFIRKTIYTQGMLELFRNYCSKNKCLECELGKKIFN